MTRFIIIVTVLLTTSSCRIDSPEKSGQGPGQTDTISVKTWLTKVIIDARNNEPSQSSEDQLRSALTEDYYNYKSTDITLEYDTITREQFDEKWKTKFQTKYVGRMGFFNWCQDCGPIKIFSCKTIKTIGDTVQVYHVVLQDVRWHTNSEMGVKVIFKDNRTLIADVRHYD